MLGHDLRQNPYFFWQERPIFCCFIRCFEQGQEIEGFGDRYVFWKKIQVNGSSRKEYGKGYKGGNKTAKIRVKYIGISHQNQCSTKRFSQENIRKSLGII